MRLLVRVGPVALAGLLVCLKTLSPSTQTQTPPPKSFILEGNRLYYEGRHKKAVAAYQKAIRRDPGSVEAYLNSAVIWAELGATDEAATWFRKAAELSPEDPSVRTALAEAEYRQGRLNIARREAESALALDPRDAYAQLLLGRIALESDEPHSAVAPLEKAAEIRPELTLAHYWLGRALEAMGDDSGAVEAYQKAALKDSYFTQARYRLSRVLMRLKHYHTAWEQIAKLVDTAPLNKRFRYLQKKVRPRLRDSLGPSRKPRKKSSSYRKPEPLSPAPEGQVPLLRVGIGTDGMGKPLPWDGLRFTCNTRFEIFGGRGRHRVARGWAGQKWSILRSKSRGYLELYSPKGKLVYRTRRPIRVRPDPEKGGWTYLKEAPKGRNAPKDAVRARTLRGEIEAALHPGGEGLRIVNVVDLESYTQGVLSAEMPIRSPMEALKAQAVIARTHALYIQKRRPRHRSQGYDLCDGQHCQVYYGVGSESLRAQEIVRATRGRVVAYMGRLAHMLYSSNSGGHTQSSGDIGWGDVPYLAAMPDVGPTVPVPSSPWELRQWLRNTPAAYSAPSDYVHASHYRWTRVVPAADLETRLDRNLRIGRLKGILPLKRSVSGHVDSILVRGSRRSRVIDDEMDIRGLLGVGSQRSTLFVIDTEYDSMGRPEDFIFYGGGWGHGVGLCQSGAMGRAERGQSYARILKAYYKGVEIGNLRY